MTDAINIYTIGFTKKTAREFFESLSKSGVKRVIDTRLNNVSQLAGFAKCKDIEYFLKTICQIEYQHAIDLAPTKEMLDEYKKKGGDWETYEQRFLELMESRKIEEKISPEIVESSCLLCSEAQPHHCHRRLVAEYLHQKWGNLNICHL